MWKNHPTGIRTLFFTEMWERFSYYGMRALLVLYLVDAVEGGGLGLTDGAATAIYGLYTAAIYLVALPGGWIADRFLGGQRAVWHGGILIAIGHFVLALPRRETFFLGLFLIVLGTGLLKPNISVLVGELYGPGDPRRDAGFTLFYMGINLGAFLGPILCGFLGQTYNWHYGFAASGVGMVAGLIQYRWTRHHLGEAGRRPGHAGPMQRREVIGVSGAGTFAVSLIAAVWLGWIPLDPEVLARWMAVGIVIVAIAYFLWVFVRGGLNPEERRRVGGIVVLFMASALFWAGFEQAGSSFNLFADRHTLRGLSSLDVEIPTSWFQSLGPIFIIVGAPLFASLWIHLARLNLEPSIPVKFALGLIFLSLGFLVMAGAATGVAAGSKVWPTWLIGTYLFHTAGELCLSPVGLSSVTRLAPKRLVGQMMGVWFLATSLGNLIAGLLAGVLETDAVEQMPGRYLLMALLPFLTATILLTLSRMFTAQEVLTTDEH